MQKTVIIIPIRVGSTRLPGKFSEMIEGIPMVIRVMRSAIEADIGPVYVACDDGGHMKFIEENGGKAILTRKEHSSGTDRVYEALQHIDPDGKFEYVVNLQADVPFIKPSSIKQTVDNIVNSEVDIGTIAAKIIVPSEIRDPNVVKIAMNDQGRALYFSRSQIPYNAVDYYHHIGVYAFKKESLSKFISLGQTTLEKQEKLEQLRALENGMIINVGIVEEVPITVDTPEDLVVARNYAKKQGLYN
jgi:3-deoxy-manno-octulosonate cytidylyltransferase (CMP-KDO synthetase)